jgi:hypothetical protein
MRTNRHPPQAESSRFGINSALWTELRPEDFDGHTEFVSMDAEQRLAWLSEIARFVHDVRQWRGSSTPQN